jgi:hypothetical protein
VQVTKRNPVPLAGVPDLKSLTICSLVYACAENPMASRLPTLDYWRVTVAFSSLSAEKATVTAR